MADARHATGRSRAPVRDGPGGVDGSISWRHHVLCCEERTRREALTTGAIYLPSLIACDGGLTYLEVCKALGAPPNSWEPSL